MNTFIGGLLGATLMHKSETRWYALVLSEVCKEIPIFPPSKKRQDEESTTSTVLINRINDKLDDIIKNIKKNYMWVFTLADKNVIKSEKKRKRKGKGARWGERKEII